MSRSAPAAAVPPERHTRRSATAEHTGVAPSPTAPRFATLQAAAVYLLAALALGYPAFAGQFLVNANSDQYIAGYAFREFAAASLRGTGSFPLWNPYMFGGMPFVAAMHGDIFYPTFLLRMVMPTDAAMTWGFIIHAVLAGLFTFRFLRAVGLGFHAALVGGLAYMLGGNVAGLVSPGHDGKLYVATLLPLALLFVHRGVRDGRRWAWGALAVTITLAVLSPHPQLLQYLLLVAGAYALFAALGTSAAGETLARPVALKRLALAAAAVVVGMLGGAVQYLPLFEYTAWSPRAGGKGWEHAVSYSMPPEELINTYLPQFSGILQEYWGRNGIHLHSEYIGAAVLVLVGLAWGLRGGLRRFVWFWTGALVVSTLWALGGHTPFYSLVYALVPGTKFFRAPSTMLYVVSFCTAVLAAAGVERALARGVRPRYLLAWVGVAVLVAVLATSGGLTSLAMSFADPRRAGAVEAGAPALVVGAWRSLLAVVAVAGVLFAMGRGRIPARAAGWALAAVVALDLWSVARRYWMFSPPASVLYRSDAVIEYMKRQPQPGRVAALALAPMTGAMRDPFLSSGDGRGTGFMVHGIRNVVGYHGNELGRYQQLTGWETDYPDRLSIQNLWRLTNLRWLYTNAPQAPIEGMRRVAGPVANAAGNSVSLYEFPGESPAAWVAPIAVEAPDESVLATVLDPRFDVRRAALFDTAAVVPVQPVPPELPPPSEVAVRVQRYEPGRISLELDRPAPKGAALVVSENYYPGWTATADGKAAPIGRTDYVLIGVALPEGARRVELAFASPRYETGKAITLAALAVAALALVAGVVVEGRKKEA